MKAALVIGSLGLLLALANTTSCSIDHPSDAIACGTQTDCDGSLSCVDGYCVTSSTICPSECTTCDTTAKTCTLDGNGNGRVTCPDGFNCTISCGANRCRDVDCSKAASCNVVCSSPSSCESVTCGPGPCQITCSGANSCKDVDCRDSCACDVTCSGAGSCETAQCPNQCDSGSGCSSQLASCSSC